MKKGNTKLFLDKSTLYKAVNLRRNGYALTSLAIIFNCDRTSLAYQFSKYQISPLTEVYTLERIVTKTIPKNPPQWKVVNGEKINLGKSYKEYLQTA